MHQPPVKLQVMLYLAEALPSGRDVWTIENHFPSVRVRTVLARLERDGFVRGEVEGTRRHGKVYYRTGKQLGPQQKLDAFEVIVA